MDPVQLATIASILVAALSLLFAVWVYRRQMNAQLFLEYTRRYEQIMESLPPEERSARLDTTGDPPPESTAVTTAALRYLNLCSEEFYLWRRGYLAGDIWRIWEAEMERTLRSPLLQREWSKLRSEFSSYSDFARYVDSIQRAGKPPAA